MSEFHTSDDVFDLARNWKYRVILASMPTTTGVIVRAVLAKQTRVGWAYGRHCEIDIHGHVFVAVRQPDGQIVKPYPIGHVNAVRDAFRRLADHCKLSESERNALFDELRKWVRKDHRASSDLDKAKNLK
jgi:hypothetical protein